MAKHSKNLERAIAVQGFAIGMERMQSRVKRVVARTANMIQYGVGNILDKSESDPLQSRLICTIICFSGLQRIR